MVCTASTLFLSATEALVDLKVVEAICDAAAAKSAAGTRVAA